MSYEDDIKIDEQALDVEWLDQAQRMVKYCRIAAEAHRDMDFAKEELDAVRARLDQAIRADPDAYGLSPGARGAVTEGSIQSAILLDDDYRKSSKVYMNLKYENDVAASVVRAFDHRKSALENLVRLHGQSYFAGPSIPRDLAEERRRRDVEVQARIGARMKRGTRA